MLTFTFPALLVVPAAVLVGGAAAIWRARVKASPVSSLRLWRDAAGSESTRTRRRVDPWWACLLLTAALTAIALARPQWSHGSAGLSARPTVHLAVRSLPGSTQLYVRVEGEKLPARTLGIVIDDGHTSRTSMTVGDAAAGAIVDLRPAERYVVTLVAADTPFYRATFQRPRTPRFALHIDPSADPALATLFRLQPGATDDPTLARAVLLTDVVDPPLASLPDNSLVVAGPDSQFPGLSLGPWVTLADNDSRLLAPNLPSYIHFENVRLHRLRTVSASGEWSVVVSAKGHPLVLRRQDPAGRTLLWLACQPTRDSVWPLDPSFVLTFTTLLERALPLPPTAATDWPSTTSILPFRAARPATPLTPVLLIVAAVSLLGCIAGFSRRVGHRRL